MDDDLRAFLKAQTALPFIWRDSDCFRLPGAWVERLTGVVLPWPEYSTEEEALELVRQAGGATALADSMLAAVGWEPVLAPSVGAVAVIPVVSREGMRAEVGAIWTGRRWAARAKRGLWFGRADPLMIWEAGNG